jgi:hypothetical protein
MPAPIAIYPVLFHGTEYVANEGNMHTIIVPYL